MERLADAGQQLCSCLPIVSLQSQWDVFQTPLEQPPRPAGIAGSGLCSGGGAAGVAPDECWWVSPAAVLRGFVRCDVVLVDELPLNAFDHEPVHCI